MSEGDEGRCEFCGIASKGDLVIGGPLHGHRVDWSERESHFFFSDGYGNDISYHKAKIGDDTVFMLKDILIFRTQAPAKTSQPSVKEANAATLAEYERIEREADECN